MSHARTELAALLRESGDDVPLDRAAALIACEERPDADPEVMLDQLDRIAAKVRIPDPSEVFDAVARLNHLMFTELGFVGDRETYDDPDNSLLDGVLLRRKGLPILLSIVYIAVARRAGVHVDPVGFPGHFLVSPRCDERFWIDVFDGGQIVREEMLLAKLANQFGVTGPPARVHLQPTPGRAVVYRLSNNLKNSFLRRSEMAGALRAVERMLMCDPSRVDQHRDRGLMLHELGRVDEAIDALERYLRALPEALDAGQVRAHVERLKTAASGASDA